MALTEATIAKLAVAGITGGLNLGGGIIQQSMSNKATERANEQARKWQLADRLHDEQYNNPVAQAFRLRQAGIGGDYSNIVSSGQTKSNTAPVQVPEQVMNLNSIGTAGLDAYNQIRIADADIAVSEAQANLYRAEADKTQVQTDLLNIDREYARALKDIEVAHGNQQVAFLDVQTDNEKIKGDIQKIEKDIIQATANARKQLAEEQVRNIRLTNGKLEWEAKGKQYEVENILPKQAVNYDRMNEFYKSATNENKQNIANLRKQWSVMNQQEKLLAQSYIQGMPETMVAQEMADEFKEFNDKLTSIVAGRLNAEGFDNSSAVRIAKLIIEVGKGLALGAGAFAGAKSFNTGPTPSAPGGYTVTPTLN